VFAAARPGQFAQLDVSSAALPAAASIAKEQADVAGRGILLRRPFSFAEVQRQGDAAMVEILYCTVGPASLRMTTLSAGDSISVLGPLGRGFWIPPGKKTAVLVSGGMGAGPLLHMAEVLTAEHPHMEVAAFAGARTAEALPFEARLDKVSQELGYWLAEYAGYGIRSVVATDDGSVGYCGLVTDALRKWLDGYTGSGSELVIFGCGPEAMLAAMAAIAEAGGIDCQVSMERMMACGIGLCQSCVVQCRTGDDGETVNKLCCRDGPVFDSREVVFAV